MIRYQVEFWQRALGNVSADKPYTALMTEAEIEEVVVFKKRHLVVPMYITIWFE